MTLLFSWLLNILYGILVLLLAPLLVLQKVLKGKTRGGWSEKLFGNLPRRGKELHAEAPLLWCHAVSVGEVLQLQYLLQSYLQHRPDDQILISTTTTTGYQVAREKYPDQTVCYFPLDFTWSVKRALSRVAPNLIVLVELELWPNYILEASKQKIPLVLINGRLSEKSFRGYSWIRPLMKRLLSCFALIAVQNSTYRDRFLRLGANPDCVEVTGTIKLDGLETNKQNPHTQRLREVFRLSNSDVIFLAGSTQSPEEEYAIQSYLEARKTFPQVRLLLVPRHAERFEEVAQLIQRYQLPLLRRSHLSPHMNSDPNACSPSDMECRSESHKQTDIAGNLSSPHQAESSPQSPAVLLLDTLGELASAWGLADVAYVGGSLGSRGGQNMMEPAAYGVALMFGPHTWNFQQITHDLLEKNAAVVVHSQEEMQTQLMLWLANPVNAKQCGQNAQDYIMKHQGAVEQTLQRILSLEEIRNPE